MAAISGAKFAKIIGDLHEECGGNPHNEICMDLQNNSVGRSIGVGIRRRTDVPTTCLSKCMLALADHVLAPAPFGNCAPPGPPTGPPLPKYS